jgi:tetraacyldisaccharide 4'-kinase
VSARRPWARPLVPLYAAALAVKDRMLRSGAWKTRSLRSPVISVGSVSAGGAGKTPVVIALAQLLQEEGWAVNVLSRGYGRMESAVQRVEPEVEAAVRRFGDEPILIAEKTGVAVWVGSERFEAGSRAETAGAAASHDQRTVHLLDDGFQHRHLRRTIDIALVTEEDFNDSLLPTGNLREGVSALARADVVIVREDEFQTVAKQAWTLMREGAQMWTVRRTLRFPAPLFVFGAGLRPVAFCAIARPEGFAGMLLEAGCGVVETVAFADHHSYGLADMQHVINVAKTLNGSGFVTTEKDAVKLTAAMRERLESAGPLMVVALEAEFADPQAVLRAIEAKLRPGEARAT